MVQKNVFPMEVMFLPALMSAEIADINILISQKRLCLHAPIINRPLILKTAGIF